MRLLCIIMFVFLGIGLNAQDLVYKPRNPNFGGDTFNYQWLLNSADSQNLYKDPDAENNEQLSQIERFTQNLNNQLLNQVSRSLFQQQFGTGGATGGGLSSPGIYTFGSLSVEILQSNLGLVVNILDIFTGEQSQVIIPGN